MLELEFNINKAYSDVVLKGKNLSKRDYMALPIVQWAVKNIGPLKTTKVGEILPGDGWEIYADWQYYLNNVDEKPRVVLKCKCDLDSRLVTEFWMKFQ